MSVAIVPVYHLSTGKSRLGASLERANIEKLSICMLEDILEALSETASVDRILVVTPDARVVDCARAMAADALLRPAPGLNDSIDAANDAAALVQAESTLVVLGDVAGARPEELESLFTLLDEELNGRGVVVAPSRDGGTSALLRAPAGVIPSRFGRDSAKHHREACAQLDVPHRELALPSLAVDLDHPEDLEHFLESSGSGPRTRKLLAELGWPLGSLRRS